METKLHRGISQGRLVWYGVGTIVGAGVYALLGEVAAVAGAFSPLSFLGAATAVAFSALSFGELSARYPVAAGEAEFVSRGFASPMLATTVGLLVATAGCVSAATLCDAFVGYARAFVELPDAAVVLALCTALGFVAISGVAHAVGIAVALTALEVAGLLGVGLACAASLAGVLDAGTAAKVAFEAAARGAGGATTAGAPTIDAVGVATGSLLAVYAFLGFEDMVNLAEEVKEPQQTMPRAIAWAVTIATVLYLSFVWLAVSAVPIQALAASPAPLATVLEYTVGSGTRAISAVSLAAMMNGVLVQLIMSARVIFGLAERGSLPAALAYVPERTRTPVVATAVSLVVIVALALWFPLAALARVTSMLALSVFVLVDLALVAIKLRGEPAPDDSIRELPVWVPVTGAVLALGFLVFGLL